MFDVKLTNFCVFEIYNYINLSRKKCTVENIFLKNILIYFNPFITVTRSQSLYYIYSTFLYHKHYYYIYHIYAFIILTLELYHSHTVRIPSNSVLKKNYIFLHMIIYSFTPLIQSPLLLRYFNIYALISFNDHLLISHIPFKHYIYMYIYNFDIIYIKD